MNAKLKYLKGDATNPKTEGNKILCHVCNDVGKWGKGFVLALSKKWKEPENEYLNWYKTNDKFMLGEVQFVQTEKDIWVANIIGQRDIVPNNNGIPPVRYEAIDKAFSKINEFAKKHNASVHMPRIGCGLAGGEWSKIEPIIIDKLINHGINVYVYDL